MMDLSASHACGSLAHTAFDLRITRPGCEFTSKSWRFSREIEGLLHDWFENSAISGYGDMQSLETKVDHEVRNAREIPASEFEVKPEFLQYIQKLWGEHFLPHSVRAEPYKIHLYGPGGHFKSHRDTPETGLVGTFLVGLGDTSSASTGHFHIGNKMLKARAGSWVAFHPDVPHEITKLEDGYRAVMAFKIFRAKNGSEDVLPAKLEARMKTILDQIPTPFGLFTTHQYSIGTTRLNGFDALLSAYARSRHDTQAHMLPVVTEFNGEAFFEEQSESVTTSRVYPFTGAHVDMLLNRNVVQAKKEVQWLDELSDIPFYTWDLKASSEVWQEDYPEGTGFTGNEADSSREDSIYLSYAILFLPRTSK
jgi:2OG-Fe(II) oxygenase superfamily